MKINLLGIKFVINDLNYGHKIDRNQIRSRMVYE